MQLHLHGHRWPGAGRHRRLAVCAGSSHYRTVIRWTSGYVSELLPPHKRNTQGLGLHIFPTIGILVPVICFWFATRNSGWCYLVTLNPLLSCSHRRSSSLFRSCSTPSNIVADGALTNSRTIGIALDSLAAFSNTRVGTAGVHCTVSWARSLVETRSFDSINLLPPTLMLFLSRTDTVQPPPLHTPTTSDCAVLEHASSVVL